MAEPIVIDAEATEAPAPKTSRYKNFKLNHPRTARVVGIAAVTTVVLGGLAWKNKRDADKLEGTTPDVDTDDSSETTN